MNTAHRFNCPACGFTVFNRRLAHCESCRAPLPEAMRFSEADLARLDEDAARNEKIRRDLAQDAERAEAAKQRRRGDGG